MRHEREGKNMKFDRRISRRSFLAAAGVSAATLALTACGEKYDDRISYFFPLSYLNALLR